LKKIRQNKIIILFTLVLFASVLCQSLSYAESAYELLRSAEKAFKAGKLKEAEEACRGVIKINPEYYPAYNILAIISAQRENGTQEAILYLKRSLEISKEQPNTYNQIASLYNLSGKTEDAIKYYKEGVKHNPSNYQLNYNLGLMYLLEAHEPAEAVKYFRQAEKVNPNYDRLLYITGFSYILAGNEAMVLEYITKLRGIKNEYLATMLEETMRKNEEGNDVDMGTAVEEYSKQPRSESAKIVSGQKPQGLKPEEKSSNISISPGNTTATVKGSGTVTVKRKYRPTY
jgi:tetratricopeptide (TPR) repeat protein